MASGSLNCSLVLLLGPWLGCFAPPAASQSKAEGQEERIRRIEVSAVNISLGADEQPLQMDLEKLLATFKVPGLSMAVIDDYQIAWTKTYGVTDTDSNKPVTTATLFQAGSISKPVAATGALLLVEQGKLSLDEDVNRKLKSWKVPENEFTKSEKVTLRRLMSHTGGLTVHGFPGYDVDAPLPSLVQIFNGEKPANTAPIRVDIVPGTEERYSGGGVTIEQQLMIDVTGKPFPEFMRKAVFEKIGMADSSYEQPLPPPWAAHTAGGTMSDGNPVHGRWHIYPELAAAGLWTTPTDLAKFAIEIALSKQGKANHVLSEKMTKEMLTPVTDDAALGFFLEKQNPGQFGHNGADEGFQAMLEMNAQTGKGLVIMANSDRGLIVAGFLLTSVAKEYGWNYKSPSGEFGTLLVLAKVKGASAALARYTALKNAGGRDPEIDEGTLNGLGYMLLYGGQEQDAIAIFKRNVQEYPQSWNVYDSLGEAYLITGQKELAVANYEKSLELNPKNQNGADKLKKLRDTK
jgi:CubicO group peptidase (beta-lactamase class C family)